MDIYNLTMQNQERVKFDSIYVDYNGWKNFSLKESSFDNFLSKDLVNVPQWESKSKGKD